MLRITKCFLFPHQICVHLYTVAILYILSFDTDCIYFCFLRFWKIQVYWQRTYKYHIWQYEGWMSDHLWWWLQCLLDLLCEFPGHLSCSSRQYCISSSNGQDWQVNNARYVDNKDFAAAREALLHTPRFKDRSFFILLCPSIYNNPRNQFILLFVLLAVYPYD